MGNGASSDHQAGTERPMSRPHSAAAGNPRKQKVLANQAPRRSPASFNSPAALKAAEASRHNASHNTEAKSVALQRVAAQRRAEAHSSEEDAIRAFTRNADPKSLRVLQLIQQADAVPQSNPAEKLRLLRQCYPVLEEVPKERFDQLAVTVYQQEGDIYYQQMDIQNAKDTYSRAITLAEKRVARQDTDMYMVLKRYVLSMIGMARIWYDHERDHQGFKFVDHKHPKVPAADGNNSEDGNNSSLSSLESSLSSDAGSVFSLNEAILRSMAPRPPRRQTGPLFKRMKIQAPHTLKNSQFDREDEFVLHSRMTRELVASPCELLLLRCCEVVQIGHNAQSELLIPPQIELAQIYEDLALYSRALLLVRRCLGILCSVYDYDHPWVIQLMQRADRLKALLDDQLRNEMATKIQATWKMHKAMQALADALGHPVKRHQWIPRKYRTTPDLDYLGDFVGDMPDNEQLGEDEDEETDDGMRPEDPTTWAVVPQVAPVRDISLESDRPRQEPSYDAEEREPPNVGAMVQYAPTQHSEGGDTFTAMVPNANVIGTTQDTQTDTDVQHTEFGDVLTVRTTTVTKTITEDLAHSGEEEEEEEEDEEDEEEPYEEEDQPSSLLAPPPPPPPPVQRRRSPKQPPQRRPSPPRQQRAAPPPPAPHKQHKPPAQRPQPPTPESPYSDEEEESDDYYEDEYSEPPSQPQYSPRDTSTEAQPRDHHHRRPKPREPHRPPPPPQQQPREQRKPRDAVRSTPQPPSKTSTSASESTRHRDERHNHQHHHHHHHQQQVQRQPSYSDVSVSSSTLDDVRPPPPRQQQHKTKQTQVQPRGHAAATQTHARNSPQLSASSQPPSRKPSPRQHEPRDPTPEARPLKNRNAPPPRQEMQPAPPRRTTTGTQCVPEPQPVEEAPVSAASRKPRQAPPAPYTEDEIPSLVVHDAPPRAAPAPPSRPQNRNAPTPPQQRPPQPQEQPVDNDRGDDYPDEDYSERDDSTPAATAAAAAAFPPPKPYVPAVEHNSKREPFRDLVEPSEAYPTDVNGAPVFLPPLPFRAGLAPNGVPLPPKPQDGQLVVRVPSRNGAQPSPHNGTLQLYDPRKIDPNAQPGMPMILPSPANGYPRLMQNAPLPPAPPKTTTRDHTIIKTRIVRTYRRGDSTEGDSSSDGDDGVFEQESHSSWETSGSVSWEASEDDGSSSGGSSNAAPKKADRLADTKKPNAPRRSRTRRW